MGTQRVSAPLSYLCTRKGVPLCPCLQVACALHFAFIMKKTDIEQPFLLDITELRRRAREHIEMGAVTSRYRADRSIVIKVLNEALATEIVCVLRYKRHFYMSHGLEAKAAADEFLQHATEEQGHVDEIARRIRQLNGEPNFNPDGMLTRAHSEYVEGQSLSDMIHEDLVAERIAIDSYSEIIRYLGDDDSTTRRMLEGILAKEEEHAEDLADLLVNYAPFSDAKSAIRAS